MLSCKWISYTCNVSCFFRAEVITRLSYEVLSALRYLHNEKITHRNLSLNNILLDKQVWLPHLQKLIHKLRFNLLLTVTVDSGS